MTDLVAAAYWGPRQESLDQCTHRLIDFMEQLASVSPHLSRWYQRGRTVREAMERPVLAEEACIRELLRDGRSRDDTPKRRVAERMGFSIGIWTGELPDGGSASLSIVCGSYSEHGGTNSVILDYPADWLDIDQAIALMRAMVSCWSPRTAAVCADEALLETLDEAQGDLDVPVLDWVFFHRRPRTGELRPPSRVAFELDGGECIVVQDTPVRLDHVHEPARVRALAKQLGLPPGTASKQ